MYTNILFFKPIKVYTGDYSKFSDRIFIENKLLKIFNQQVISFCTNIYDSDIIIKKSLMCTDVSQNIYYLENIADDEQWKKLMTYLIEEILRK